MRIAAMGVALAVMLGIAWRALAGGELVVFPERYRGGVHYATVKRGNITEELFTSRAAIDSVQKGQPIPSGTVITMEDYRDGKLLRYVVMEKRTGWGHEYPPEKRNGEWEFQAFNADKSVNRSENLDRCFTCHKGQAQNDFVFTLDRMKTAN
jgi:Cytochrome P460